MADTINDVAAAEQVPVESATPVDQQQLAERLLAQAKEHGVELVGPDGLLNQLTKRVLETALEAEMSDHLGYDKHHPAGRNHGNSRNGVRSKMVLPRSARSRSTSQEMWRPPSPRRSYGNDNAGFPGSTRSCCRCPRGG